MKKRKLNYIDKVFEHDMTKTMTKFRIALEDMFDATCMLINNVT